jgi:hypothetical protein
VGVAVPAGGGLGWGVGVGWGVGLGLGVGLGFGLGLGVGGSVGLGVGCDCTLGLGMSVGVGLGVDDAERWRVSVAVGARCAAVAVLLGGGDSVGGTVLLGRLIEMLRASIPIRSPRQMTHPMGGYNHMRGWKSDEGGSLFMGIPFDDVADGSPTMSVEHDVPSIAPFFSCASTTQRDGCGFSKRGTVYCNEVPLSQRSAFRSRCMDVEHPLDGQTILSLPWNTGALLLGQKGHLHWKVGQG